MYMNELLFISNRALTYFLNKLPPFCILQYTCLDVCKQIQIEVDQFQSTRPCTDDSDLNLEDTFFAYLTHLQLIFDSFIFYGQYFRKCKHISVGNIIIVTTKVLSSIWMTQMWKSIGKLHSISSWPKVFFTAIPHQNME